jgi:transposase-like protein
MEVEMAKSVSEKINYESYVVRKSLEDYWRAEEKVQLVLNGMTGKIPVTTLCKLNNVSPSLYYEWREKFLASGKQGLMTNGGKSQRESDLEKKIHVLERCIGELTLERELLKKISED